MTARRARQPHRASGTSADRAAGSPGILPDVPPLALFVLTLFGLIEVSIILRFAQRMWVRRQYRTLWRFPVAMPARLAGTPGRCMDLHQRGAAITIDAQAGQEALEASPFLLVELEVARLDGSEHVARGRMQPTSVRRVGDGALRIGGPVQWDDLASRQAVIERCYDVEPYGDRRSILARRAPRYSVRLSARVGGMRARTVDVSEFGAALLVRARDVTLSVPVPISVRLPDGRVVVGRFRPLDLSTTGRRLRVGGEVKWRDTDWIAQLAPAG